MIEIFSDCDNCDDDDDDDDVAVCCAILEGPRPDILKSPGPRPPAYCLVSWGSNRRPWTLARHHLPTPSMSECLGCFNVKRELARYMFVLLAFVVCGLNLHSMVDLTEKKRVSR